MSKFKREYGDWTEYRKLSEVREIDDYHPNDDRNHMDYWQAMDEVYKGALEVLKNAQQKGYEHVIFRHGWSTSRQGKTTTRSQIRKLMRSPEATPYIIRRNSIQHDSVFVAAIRPLSMNDQH